MRRPRRRGQGASVVGLVLIGVALLCLGGLGAAAFMLRPPPLDAETLCRTDVPVAAHTIVLVDATDRLEPRHRRKLRAVLAQERARLRQYEMLSVMRLNVRRPQEPARLFARCLPRPPEETNPIFENARLNQQRWDESFESVLDAAARRAGASSGARATPVIASIRAIAADSSFEAPKRRLVIVSDLLEHDPQGFSLYEQDATFARWRAVAPLGPPDLAHVDVRLVPLDRPENAQRQAWAVDTFWPAFFDAADAQTVSIDASP